MKNMLLFKKKLVGTKSSMNKILESAKNMKWYKKNAVIVQIIFIDWTKNQWK